MKRKRFQLRIEHLWGLVALVGIFVFVNTHPIRPNDFWWHIAIGREIVSTGQIPSTDIYSYTEAGQSYPSYQMFWLMEIFLYELFQSGGPALVIFTQSLMITMAYGIVFYLCKQITNSWRIAAFGVLFAAALGLNDWNVRPQSITFLLGSLFLLAIYQYRQHKRWSWLLILPTGMLVWVNSHGTFLIGLLLIGLWWGQEFWELARQRLIDRQRVYLKSLVIPSFTLLVTSLVCLLNPRGSGIIDYIRTLTTNTVVQNLVVEWAPPNLHSLMGIIFFSYLLISVIVMALSPKRPNLIQIVTLFIFGGLGIKTSRGIVWFGIVMAPIVVDHLSSIIKRFQKAQEKLVASEGSKLLNTLFLVFILVMGVITLPWFKNYLPLPSAKAGLISAETPVEATKVLLEQNPPGRLFNSMSFGSYLIWAAYPRYQVFVDTRIELFSEKVWMDYLNISNANGDWEAKLREYGVNTLMLSREEQNALIEAALISNDWRKIYNSDNSYIFVANPSCCLP